MAYNLGTARGNITITYDSRGVAHARDDLGRFVSMSSLMADSVDHDTDRASRSFTLFGKQIIKVTAIILAAGAASNILAHAMGGLILVGQSLIPVLTASLATLPGLFLAAAGAAVVLKLALSGVGDAAKAAFAQDAEKFAEAIKKLAPEAQKAATALFGLVKVAKPVQQAIQNAFFEASAPLVQALIPAIKLLQPTLVAVGAAFGDVFAELLKFAGSADFVGALVKVLKGVSEFLELMAPGFAPLLAGFSQLAGQAGKFFASFGDSAGQALRTFGEFLGTLDLGAMWERASVVLSALGSLLSDLGSIVGSVVGAFTGADKAVDDFAGGSVKTLSNSLGIVVGKIADFLNSTQGMEVLDALSSAMSAVAEAGGDALLALLQGLSPILVALSPLVVTLARALGAILTTSFETLSPVLTTVAEALNSSLGPVIPQLVEAFAELAPVLGQVAQIFAGVLGSALATLAPVIGEIAVLLAGALLQALTALMPLIEQWGKAFQDVAAQVLPELIPLIQELAPLLGELVPFLVLGAQVTLTLLIPAMKLLGAVLPVIIGYLGGTVQFLQLLASVVIAAGNTMASIWNMLLSLTSVVWNGIKALIDSATNGAKAAVTGMVANIRSTISTLASIPGQVGGYFRAMASAAAGAIGNLLAVVKGIPGQVKGALGNLANLLFSAGQDVIQGMVNGIRSLAGRVADAARAAVSGIPGAVKNLLGISSPSKVTMALGREVSTGLALGILDTAARVQRAINDVVGLIPAQLASGFETNASVNASTFVSGSGGTTRQAPPPPPTTPGAGITVNQNVYAAPTQSAKEVGDSAVRRLVFGVATGTSGLATAGAA